MSILEWCIPTLLTVSDQRKNRYALGAHLLTETDQRKSPATRLLTEICWIEDVAVFLFLLFFVTLFFFFAFDFIAA